MTDRISIRKNLWKQYDCNDRDVLYISKKFAIPDIVTKMLLARIPNHELIDNYLTPTIRATLPDPFRMLDMGKAVSRVIQAIKSNEKITIFGDYDVDGATSTAVIINYFKMLGFSNCHPYIPDRIKEGYGPNSGAMEKFANNGTKVVITVDCGTLSFEPLAHAKSLGLDVIVIDHHLSDTHFPECYALINPNRIDETFEYRNLAAVGVTFLFICAIHKLLKQEGYFNNKAEPKILNLLDLVALGTVCDVMTITGINRTFVTQGLKILSARTNIGLSALADVSSLSEAASAYHLGYILGPRINAGGRVGKSSLGVELLTCDDYDEAHKKALDLDKYNQERKSLEHVIFDEAIKQVEQFDNKMPLIFAYGNGWHPGVIGIVCSRIKEIYNKPSAVIAFDQDIGKASARSVDGVDIGANIVNAKNAGLLVAGGGHAMAAGFTVERNKLDNLYSYLSDKMVSHSNQNNYLVRHYDLEITELAINEEMVKNIEMLAPYGNGNSEPLFLIKELKVINIDVFKGGTMKIVLGDYYNPKKPFRATLFKSNASPLGEILVSTKSKIDVVGRMAVSYYMMKRNIEFYIEDVII